ncbi:MAG: ABC transporter ATP-binding protein [Thermoplasmatota archaeon]
MSLLRVRGIEKRFGGLRALGGVDLEVQAGSITGLIGPNGAGKTTLFDCVTGFQQPDGGTVHLSGARIDGLPPHLIARRGIGRTFQLVRLLPRLSALDNLLVATRDHPGERVATALLGGWSGVERDARAKAEEWLEFVGMGHRADVPAGQLSYGQSKLVEFARVLSLETPLVLLDEPMSGINPTLRKRLLQLVHELSDDRGRTFLVIEHDIEMIMSECDDVAVMDQGRVLLHDEPETVRNDPRVAEAYLGTGRKFSAAWGGDA